MATVLTLLKTVRQVLLVEFAAMRSVPLWSCCLVLLLMLMGCDNEYPNCKNDDDCPGANQFCFDGKCQGCRTDEDCGGDCGVCKEGRCARAPGCCTADTDCPANYPKCGEDQLCQECRIDSHCARQQDVCLEGLCQRARCGDDLDCAPYMECNLKRCEYKKLCDFETIYFATDSSKLSAHQKTRLKHNLACFERFNQETGGKARLQLTGYADERSDSRYNMLLSKKRAWSVLTALEAHGVSKGQLRAVGRGEQQPAIKHAETLREHAHNRRVELYVY